MMCYTTCGPNKSTVWFNSSWKNLHNVPLFFNFCFQSLCGGLTLYPYLLYFQGRNTGRILGRDTLVPILLGRNFFALLFSWPHWSSAPGPLIFLPLPLPPPLWHSSSQYHYWKSLNKNDFVCFFRINTLSGLFLIEHRCFLVGKSLVCIILILPGWRELSPKLANFSSKIWLAAKHFFFLLAISL